MLGENLDPKRYEPPVIDLKNRNSSHTLIIELTGRGKLIFDIGASTGYLDKILKDQGNRIIGVEIDPEAATIAKQYCEQMIIDDIETLSLENYFEPHYFDVVILGDVLEHLKWPHLVLEKIRRHLKPNGYLVVSLPNIAHGDIILNLLSEKFQYTKLGLLDITHLRFFALDDIITLFENSGYQISDLQTTTVDIGATEACIDLNSVPKEVLGIIKSLPYAQTYQFVFRAYLKKYAHTIPISPPKAKITEAFNQFRETHIAPLEREITALEEVAREGKEEIREKEEEIREKEEEISQLSSLKIVLNERDATLDRIYSSHGWKALLIYYGIRNKIIPPNTKRRLLARILFKLISEPRNIFRNINATSLKKLVRYFKHCDPMELEEKMEAKLAQRPMVSRESRIEVEFDKHLVLKKMEHLDFPDHKKPFVSIIIPVWNKWQFTYQCLRALQKYTDGVPYEVIVVDNASTDETPEMFAKIKNIKVITNSSNLGFNKACNMGAKSSQGEYVLFLNNDTLVTKGWLKSMVELAEKDETIGLVGAKLIFPDGTLQEAGGIVWNDPMNLAHNCGKYDNHNSYEYNYVKEVDYCSAACMLVRKKLFERIGLFDKQFAPAYFEDTDLAFSVRKSGYKVMYQPKSEVVHLEGATAGTNIAKGYKRYQRHNQKKFYNKWKDTLKREHCKNGVDIFLARDRSRNKKRVLVIDHHVPTFDKDAGSLRMFYMLKILSELGYKIVFIGANLLKWEPYTQELQQIGVEVVYAPYIISIEDYIRNFGRYFNVVILSRPHISIEYLDCVKSNCTKAKIIYDTVDLGFLRESRRAEVENSKELLEEAEKLKSTELYLARNSDITLVVSSAEKDLLLKEDPSLNIEIVSIIHHITKPRKSFSERKGILFVGGFIHVPNIDAVTYFIKTTFPILKQKLSDISLYIVGSNPPKEVLALKSKQIVVAGYIEDLTPYFEGCKVFIAPLRYGAGVKGKIIHSMSHGLPVVTTSIGAEGIKLTDGKDVLIADEPEQFAEKVTLLYNDKNLWDTLSQNSIKNVEKYFSNEAAKQKIKAILETNQNNHERSHV